MVRTLMSYRARQELLVRVAPRYQEARGAQKSHILDEFVAPPAMPASTPSGCSTVPCVPPRPFTAPVLPATAPPSGRR